MRVIIQPYENNVLTRTGWIHIWPLEVADFYLILHLLETDVTRST